MQAPSNAPWWRSLTSYHWFVFLVASLAWLFDCLDQQLFILARTNAIQSLLALGGGVDFTKVDPGTVKEYGGYATAIFVAGWATGGLIFGAMGDRFGRAKTLAFTVLLYSVCTGLSAFSKDFTQFAIYRFITGLGVGGVFGLAVALVADSLPDFARAKALGLLQALSAIGNVTAGLCAMAVASHPPTESWKTLFWIGAAPAFLCIFIMIRLKEPEKWVRAREAHLAGTGKAMGSYGALFGETRWRKNALLGMVLCIAGVVGLWGIGFFSPELVGPVIEKSLKADGLTGAELGKAKGFWISMNLIVQNIGAFIGMIAFSKLAQGLGRKKAFGIGYVCAFAVTLFFFQRFSSKGDLWMSALMGFFQLGLFAGFAIYLPELFPTRLRSTGTSFCYNVGRFIAATGPFTLGVLQKNLGTRAVAALGQGADAAAQAAAKLDAFRNAASYMSAIFLLGLVALFFLPETKDQPLPED